MIRIYIENLEHIMHLNTAQIHYLKNVMRCENDQKIHVFNNQDEWTANIQFPNIILIEKVRSKSINNNLKIGISYIKKNKLELAVEKATELGVDEIYLLITHRVNNKNVDSRRLQKITIEAAEQCGRIGVPKIYEHINLYNLPKYNWVVADKTDSNIINQWKGDGILIGPEGGWSQEDLEILKQYNKINLHNNILRSETAVCTALSLYNGV